MRIMLDTNILISMFVFKSMKPIMLTPAEFMEKDYKEAKK